MVSRGKATDGHGDRAENERRPGPPGGSDAMHQALDSEIEHEVDGAPPEELDVAKAIKAAL